MVERKSGASTTEVAVRSSVQHQTRSKPPACLRPPTTTSPDPEERTGHLLSMRPTLFAPGLLAQLVRFVQRKVGLHSPPRPPP